MRMFHWESANFEKTKEMNRAYACVHVSRVWTPREREREREESKGRARSGWMHSGYFWIDPDIRRPCFLGPCFKLFRIINELNRIRACRLPHCPRSRRGRKLLSLQKFTTPGYLALPVPATKSKGKEEEKKRKRTSTIRAQQTDLFCHVGIK